MTKNEIIRLAQQAGAADAGLNIEAQCMFRVFDSFAALVAAAEGEVFRKDALTQNQTKEILAGDHQAAEFGRSVTGSHQGSLFPPLEHVNRPHVDTAAAAHYLLRKQQTLREWACKENGPLRPLRVNGRLAWAVADLRQVLGQRQLER